VNRVGYVPKSEYQGLGKTEDQPIERKEIVLAPAPPTNGFTPDQPIDRFCRTLTSDQPIPRR
jgi:hypothetical protein